ncbi:C39 family peptidase [Capilliphycus salinus ALCB114379]|uniref:C39 family peptidase n=1 Tax=Capilliphycus salinus TaxID=2768948 RepID=UPI0039A74F08
MTSTPARPSTQVKLNVTYFSQLDNYRDSHRTCFSSACAMLLDFLRPGVIKSDDDYIREVFRRGDTPDSSVQIDTLRHFGVAANFVQNANNNTLKEYLNQGIPVPCGILHKGPSSSPSGSGHWIIVIGYEDDENAPGGGNWLVNDPWGEIDHASGTYISENGKMLKYSYNLMNARWTVLNNTDGWCILAKSSTN